MSADCRRPRSQGFSLKKKKKWEGCAGSPGYEAGPQYGPHVRWFVGTKHFPESKNTFKYPKHVHPRIQNTVPRIQKGFGFWDVFCPYHGSYVTHASGAPLPEPNHHFLNNNNIEKNKSFIVVTSKLYLHNY